MRKKPGYREVSFFLTEEQYALLEHFWRYQTKEQYITNAALALLIQALQERVHRADDQTR